MDIIMAMQKTDSWSLFVKNMQTVLQGSIATRLRCGGLLQCWHYYIFTAESYGEKNFENISEFDEITDKSIVVASFRLTMAVTGCLWLA